MLSVFSPMFPAHCLVRILSLVLPLFFATLVHAATNVTAPYAWSETGGWINHAPTGGGVYVYDDHLEGYAWAENIGWIQLGSHTGGGAYSYANTGSADWGVNRSGTTLNGYAWSETAGWINFAPSGGSVAVNAGTGQIDGYAWGQNVGWIHLRNGSAYGLSFSTVAGITLNATTGTSQSAAIASAFAAPLSATLLNATGNPIANASVTFTAPASGASGTFGNASNTITVTTNASGVATAGTFTANGTVGGPYAVTASYGGQNATFSLTNTAASATVTLAGTPNPAYVTQNVIFTATVVGINPTGTVQFKDGVNNLGAPVALASGHAGYSTSSLSIASHSITAVYGGDGNNAGATSNTVTEVITLIPQTITGFTVTPNVGWINGQGTLSASGGASGQSIVYGSQTPGTCTVNGSTVSYLAAGTCTLTANQAAGGNYAAAAEQSLSLTVLASIPTSIPALTQSALWLLALALILVGWRGRRARS